MAVLVVTKDVNIVGVDLNVRHVGKNGIHYFLGNIWKYLDTHGKIPVAVETKQSDEGAKAHKRFVKNKGTKLHGEV